MSEPERDRLQAIKGSVTGLIVLVTVLVLLRGFEGTADAIKIQLSTLATSFFGGGDEVVRVLLHTMPLAIAAGVVTFAIASHWLRFESLSSFLIVACIVIGAAGVGGFLRGLVASSQSVVRMPNTLHDSSVLAASEQPVGKSAIQQLREIEWFAEPNLDNAPPAKIPPLNVLPRVPGILGSVSLAINQLLGYLVAYQPRLFLAAILSGAWVGWSWQRQLIKLHEHMIDRGDDTSIDDELPKAA